MSKKIKKRKVGKTGSLGILPDCQRGFLQIWGRHPEGTSKNSDICKGFRSFWLKLYNGGLWEKYLEP